MDTNTNDYILVLEDKESKKLSVVSSVDAEGKVQTVEPLDAHSGQFMKFSENDSIFKNFMENFTRQFNGKHSDKYIFYTLRFDCSFAAANTIKPQLL